MLLVMLRVYRATDPAATAPFRALGHDLAGKFGSILRIA